jgi:hypothetical protein
MEQLLNGTGEAELLPNQAYPKIYIPALKAQVTAEHMPYSSYHESSLLIVLIHLSYSMSYTRHVKMC